MTQDDLATLLRDELAATEPPWSLDPATPVRRGRRRLRVRRTVGTAAAAAVLAACSAVAAPLLAPDDDARHGIDPATRRALQHYDAQAMPALMDDHVRAVLEHDVPDLDGGFFVATDDLNAPLPPRRYAEASRMEVQYGDAAHAYSVDLTQSRSEAEGSARTYCANGLEAPAIFLSCDVSSGPGGETVISKLWALRPQGRVVNGEPVLMVVGRDDITTTNPDQLYFEQEVKVVKSETFVAYVDERVHAPTQAAAEAAFRVPVSDLVAIGTDPALVIPPPGR